MEQAAFPISGLSSRSLYRALCRDALTDDRIMIGVALCGSIAGFLIIIVDWWQYWAAFSRRHPLLAVMMLKRRLFKARRSHFSGKSLACEQQVPICQGARGASSGRRWSDSSACIAKGVFIHIDPTYRRRGISVQLYKYLFNLLASRGVKRIDARVEPENSSALLMHVRLGFHLEKAGNSMFATLDLE
jgi:GNAT superfamily N-acetyltransferase